MPLGLFKNINNTLNRKISLAFLLAWLFGVLLVLIGFVSVSFGPKNTLPNKQEQPFATSTVQKIEDNINQEQIITELEKTETNYASAQVQNNTKNTQQTEKQTKYYTVTKVVDGDTIDVDMNGVTKRLRLIGIDTPEVVDPRKPVECFGHEASKKASALLLNQKVKLESDSTQKDRDIYGRLLRYVYRKDGLFYNKWIIKNGYAHEYTYIRPYKYQAEFKQAENYARENQLGLWQPGICNTKKQANNQNTVTKTGPIMQRKGETSAHVFYTSDYYSSKFYYCDTDSARGNLSEKYLESYPNEATILKIYPTKTLHEPCK